MANWPVSKNESAQLRPLEEDERELFDAIVASAEIEAFAWIAAAGDNERPSERKRSRARQVRD